ncbi:hypothetical protein WH47_01083 [Habropoda laboriosa]|uniref:Uncharacterized protein n=1 Tax=Habropoda laboriosa TaxID=597456 RepID=A0A0L7R0X4_9HYME|nr:hypothetical protein WH47_01083 [Habropoda laboriosa]
MGVALYGSPIWAGDLMARRRSREKLRRVERRLAIRCIRGYRTTFHSAAVTLAGLIFPEHPAKLHLPFYPDARRTRVLR